MRIQKIVTMSYRTASEAVEQRARDMAEEKDLTYAEALGRVLSEDVQLMVRHDQETLGQEGAAALPFNQGGEGGGEGDDEKPMSSLEAGLEINKLVREYMGESGEGYTEAQKHVFETHPRLKVAYGSL